MKLFVPKNRVFYELFEKVAANSALMGNKLRALVSEPDFDKRTAIINQIEDLEHANDELTHNIFTELGRNFITPFDREDIHYLATSLDDIADTIYASAKKINSLENQADDVFDMSIERLFETEPDAKEVIKKREIYTVMEIATDKCEDAANVIESIIIKYA